MSCRSLGISVSADPIGRRPRARLTFLPAALLTLVAIRQVWLATFDRLSPWLGGGFGMFAVMDAPERRGVVCYGTDANGREYRVRLTFVGEGRHGGLTEALGRRILAQPSATDLRTTADILRDCCFRRIPEKRLEGFHTVTDIDLGAINRRALSMELCEPTYAQYNEHSSDSLRFVSVRLSVWSIGFDAVSNRIECHRLLGPIWSTP